MKWLKRSSRDWTDPDRRSPNKAAIKSIDFGHRQDGKVPRLGAYGHAVDRRLCLDHHTTLEIGQIDALAGIRSRSENERSVPSLAALSWRRHWGPGCHQL